MSRSITGITLSKASNKSMAAQIEKMYLLLGTVYYYFDTKGIKPCQSVISDKIFSSDYANNPLAKYIDRSKNINKILADFQMHVTPSEFHTQNHTKLHFGQFNDLFQEQVRDFVTQNPESFALWKSPEGFADISDKSLAIFLTLVDKSNRIGKTSFNDYHTPIERFAKKMLSEFRTVEKGINTTRTFAELEERRLIKVDRSKERNHNYAILYKNLPFHVDRVKSGFDRINDPVSKQMFEKFAATVEDLQFYPSNQASSTEPVTVNIPSNTEPAGVYSNVNRNVDQYMYHKPDQAPFNFTDHESSGDLSSALNLVRKAIQKPSYKEEDTAESYGEVPLSVIVEDTPTAFVVTLKKEGLTNASDLGVILTADGKSKAIKLS